MKRKNNDLLLLCLPYSDTNIDFPLLCLARVATKKARFGCMGLAWMWCGMHAAAVAFFVAICLFRL